MQDRNNFLMLRLSEQLDNIELFNCCIELLANDFINSKHYIKNLSINYKNCDSYRYIINIIDSIEVKNINFFIHIMEKIDQLNYINGDQIINLLRLRNMTTT